MKVRTRTQYKLVGSDYSAQEPRITTYLSGDPNMRQAYLEGKDLYCVIASNIYNNKYEENLENFPEGHVLELDGKKTVAGNDKSYKKQVSDKLEVPIIIWYQLFLEQKRQLKFRLVIALLLMKVLLLLVLLRL